MSRQRGDAPEPRGGMLSAHARIAVVTFGLCAAPYLGLRLYPSIGLQGSGVEAVVQTSRIEPSFTGMAVLWSAGDPVGLEVHIARLHEIFFESLYLSVMTITTVGYGDVAPVSRVGKILTAIEGLAGIGFVGVAFAHYFSVCSRRRREDI